MFCAWTMMRSLSLTLQPHHKERHKSVAEWQRKSEERQCVCGRMAAEVRGKAVCL